MIKDRQRLAENGNQTFKGHAQIKKLVRDISVVSLRSQGSKENFKIEDFESDLKVYSHWMAVVLVFGAPIRVTFKVHFKTSQAQLLAAPAYQISPSQINPRQALDYMREFCNLTAGGLKRAMLQQNLNLGVSLPLVSRGFDEIFFRPSGIENFSDFWKLSSPTSEIICSASFEIFETIDLSKIEMAQETDGEIEFV